MYQALSNFVDKKFTNKAGLLKTALNLSPLYRHTTARIVKVSKDLMYIKTRIPLNWRNKNFIGSIFGGSLFAATDPVYMVQLAQILGDKYVAIDKETTIKFKRPARKTAYAEFTFSPEEIETIKLRVAKENKFDLVKYLHITDENGKIFCEIIKTIYIADKKYFNSRTAKRKYKKVAH